MAVLSGYSHRRTAQQGMIGVLVFDCGKEFIDDW